VRYLFSRSAAEKEKHEETEEEKAFKEKQKADDAAAKLARENGEFRQ
jgi:hypothetical protein